MYRSNYVCFDCRKTARAKRIDTRCPHCGTAMTPVGYKWKSPKRNKKKAWGKRRQQYYAWRRDTLDRVRLLPSSLRRLIP